MLQRIALKNIKVFDESGVTINPGKITVLIGANGTGKSTILQTLSLMKQSNTMGALLYNGPLINVGSFKDLVHGQDVSLCAHIGLLVSYHDLGFPEGMKPHLASSGMFEYEAAFQQISLEQGATTGVEQRAAIGGEIGDQLEATYKPTGATVNIGQISDRDVSIRLIATNAIGQPIVADRSGTSASPSEQALMRQIRLLLSTISDTLAGFFLVPAIRGFDSLTYNMLTAEYPSDLSAIGGPESQAALVANVIASEPDRAEEVTTRLQMILHNTSRLRNRNERGRLVSEMANARKSINLVNEAFGLNQLVAPLLWLGKVPRGSIIGIEEPEIHLHPKAQAALCDLFVDIATNEQKQLILTTHSEHILMGLLAAVANGRLQPDDLAVYEFRREGDAASAERLGVNQYGQIEGGLKGFLEVDLDEIDELIKARFRPSQA